MAMVWDAMGDKINICMCRNESTLERYKDTGSKYRQCGCRSIEPGLCERRLIGCLIEMRWTGNGWLITVSVLEHNKLEALGSH